MSEPLSRGGPPPLAESPPEEKRLAVAGFWERMMAFVLDNIILVLCGVALGLAFYRPFAALGPWAQFIGFAIALTYYGIQNSRLCGGQTLGKRALGIRVVGTDGVPISLSRSFARAFLLCVVMIDVVSFGTGVVAQVLNGAMGLWMLALAYFLIFNRASRRSAHDFLAGTCVVREGDGELRLSSVSHAAIIGFAVVLVVLSGATIAIDVMMRGSGFLGLDMNQIQRARLTLLQDEHIHTAGVTYAYTWSSQTEDKSATYSAVVWWSEIEDDYAEVANRVAQVLLENLEEEGSLEDPDHIVVMISNGYDIGIWSWFRSYEFAKSPAEWAAGAPTDTID